MLRISRSARSCTDVLDSWHRQATRARERALAVQGDLDGSPRTYVSTGLSSDEFEVVGSPSAVGSVQRSIDQLPMAQLSPCLTVVPSVAPSDTRSAGATRRQVPSGVSVPMRYYTVTSCPPGQEVFLGIWYCRWRTLADTLGLPRRCLGNSGFHAWGFDTSAEAEDHWVALGGAVPAPQNG